MAKITVYRNYHFIDKDPIIDALRTMVKAEEHLSNNKASQITGVASSTFDNWFDGPTRCPRNATATQVMAALGYVRRDDMDRNGKVIIGYAKAHEYDYATEIKKQADWLLKQGRKKKPRPSRKKANGQTR